MRPVATFDSRFPTPDSRIAPPYRTSADTLAKFDCPAEPAPSKTPDPQRAPLNTSLLAVLFLVLAPAVPATVYDDSLTVPQDDADVGVVHAFPEHRDVCTAFNTICYVRT